MWIMTDPRFWSWLWEIENEIRAVMPIVYYHVWDNYPYPYFNKKYYESNDAIATISKVTDDIVREVTPDVKCKYIPHAVDVEYQKLPDDVVDDWKKKALEKICDWDKENRVLFFWNNRNARRKMSGSVLWWFKEFLDEVGHDKASLIMHTDPKDVHGQDLEAMSSHLGLEDGQLIISTDKIPSNILSLLYNTADCTINISDAEGFGLATLESLSCETPVIVNMTGGLQFQVTDGKEWFGIGIEPTSKAVIGSQGVPWIYEDRITKENFISALKEIFYMSPEERAELGKKGRAHVDKNFNFEDFKENWVNFMLEVHEEFGSWDTRKNYNSWSLLEVK
jgi:glycosyltransferase involved in cell wall biosynthesis